MKKLISPASALRRFSYAAVVGAAVIFGARLSAQITPGLIGTRYVEGTFFLEDIKEAGIDNGTGFGVRANLPIGANLDGSIATSIENIDTGDFQEKQLAATLTGHWAVGQSGESRVFADSTLGNVWQSSKWAGVKYSEDHAFYGVGVGMEVPAGDATAALFKVAYNRYFKSSLGHYWLYTIGLNHRMNDKFSILGAVTFRDSDSIIYSFGGAFRF